ncbi:hypothetical protein [Pararhodobacter sp.]
MHRPFRPLPQPRDDRGALIADALGAVALFFLAYAALHLPLVA